MHGRAARRYRPGLAGIGQKWLGFPAGMEGRTAYRLVTCGNDLISTFAREGSLTRKQIAEAPL